MAQLVKHPNPDFSAGRDLTGSGYAVTAQSLLGVLSDPSQLAHACGLSFFQNKYII